MHDIQEKVPSVFSGALPILLIQVVLVSPINEIDQYHSIQANDPFNLQE